MDIKQKITHGIIGFCVGNIILVSLFFGFSYFSKSSKNLISLESAIIKLENKEIGSVVVRKDFAELADLSDDILQTVSLTEDSREELFTVIKNLNQHSPKHQIKLADESNRSDSSENLFRMLFILFIISPPIIVVLLIVIITKLNSNKSIS